MYFFQLITLEPIRGGSYRYYFFVGFGKHCPRSEKLDNKYPNKLKLLIEDRNEIPFSLHCISFFTYIYRKYIKRRGCFWDGERINWEKEEL